MSLADAGASLPQILLWGLLPGLAMAMLLGPGCPWRERLAMAPGMGAGLIGLAGLILHDAHLPFDWHTMLPVATVPCLCAVARRGRPGEGARWPEAVGDLPLIGSALAAGLLCCVVLAVPLANRPLPLNGDAPVHGAVASAIARNGDTLPALADVSNRSTITRPRTATEAQAALGSQTGGPSPDRELMPAALLAALLLPLSLGCLAMAATGDRRIAAVTPWLAVGMLTPRAQAALGEFPLLVDSTLVVPLALSARRALAGDGHRDRVRDLILVSALVAAIWVIHGLEIVTVIACLGLFAAGGLRGLPRRTAASRAGLLGAAVAAGAALITLTTRTPPDPPSAAWAGAGRTILEQDAFIGRAPQAAAGELIRVFADLAFASQVGFVVWIVALAMALRRRRLLWAVGASIVLALAFADTAGAAHLRRLWTPLFPWSVADRLAAIQIFVIPLLGADLLCWGACRLRRARPEWWAKAALPVVVAPIVALGALGIGRAFSADVAGSGAITTADLAAMHDLDRRLPPGSVVLTQGTKDSFEWLDSETRLTPALSKAYADAHPQDSRMVAAGQACADPTALSLLLNDIDAVAVGSRPAAATAIRPWEPRCLAAVPGLEPLPPWSGTGNGPAVFLTPRGQRLLGGR